MARGANREHNEPQAALMSAVLHFYQPRLSRQKWRGERYHLWTTAPVTLLELAIPIVAIVQQRPREIA